MTAETSDLLALFSNSVVADLDQLILLHDSEPDMELLIAMKQAEFPLSLGLKLETRRGADAFRVASHVMQELEFTNSMLEELAADYASIYLNHSIQASPMESVWIDDEGLTHQEPMFQVREYYRQQGLQAEDWRLRSDDHLVMQMRFIQHLMKNSDFALAASFMDEHLLRWLGLFCDRVATRCATPWFAATALLTHAWFEEFRDLLAAVLDEPRLTSEEIEERMKPKPQAVEIPLQYMPGTGPVV